jgi:hypothetical protein
LCHTKCASFSNVVVEHLLVPHYPFVLDSAGQVIDGFVDSKVVVGSKVRVTEIEGKKFIENGMGVGYLQLVVRKGKNQLNGVCIHHVEKSYVQ